MQMGKRKAVAMNGMDRDGQMLAVSLKSRGVAQLDLCCHHALTWTERKRESKNKITKPHHNWLYSQEENRQMCNLLQCCFQNKSFNCNESILFTAFKIDLFVTSVMHNLVSDGNESLSGFLVTWTQMTVQSQVFFMISTAYGGLDLLTLI